MPMTTAPHTQIKMIVTIFLFFSTRACLGNCSLSHDKHKKVAPFPHLTTEPQTPPASTSCGSAFTLPKVAPPSVLTAENRFFPGLFRPTYGRIDM